jgi:hypothetical protein
MLPTNYDIARLRVEDMLRDADHRRLVREAKAAQKASRSDSPSIFVAFRHAAGGAIRLPWKHALRPQGGTPQASVQLVPAHPTGGGA